MTFLKTNHVYLIIYAEHELEPGVYFLIMMGCGLEQIQRGFTNVVLIDFFSSFFKIHIYVTNPVPEMSDILHISHTYLTNLLFNY